jgi:hypothetical protein
MKISTREITAPMYVLLGWLDDQRPSHYVLSDLKKLVAAASTAWNVHVAWHRRGWIDIVPGVKSQGQEVYQITQLGSEVAAEWRRLAKRRDPRLAPLIALVDMLPKEIDDDELLSVVITVSGKPDPQYSTLVRLSELRVARRLLSGEPA